MSGISPEQMFTLTNAVILPGWFAIVLAPSSRWSYTLGCTCSAIVSVLYVYCLYTAMANKPEDAAPVDFFSLEGITRVFRESDVYGISAAWYHYVAGDLIAGMFIAQDAAKRGVSRVLMAPVLFVTMMLMPAGFVLYQVLKAVLCRQVPKQATE